MSAVGAYVRGFTLLVSDSALCRACRAFHTPSDSLLRQSLITVAKSHSIPYRGQHSAPASTTDKDDDPIVSSPPVGHPWRIVSAVCIQRMPSLTREKTEIEQRYEELKDTMRAERSRLSDFELDEIRHLEMKKEREKRALEEDIDTVEAAKLEGTDEFEELQEAREVELQAFHPASRETEADKAGDMKSLQRKLDRVLYLLVKKPRKEYAWQLPQGGLEEQESLIETAKRELAEECGSQLKVDFLSNTPWAFHSYHHPSSLHQSSGFIGTKVFFLKAMYRGGEVEVDNEELVDHMWVTKEELKDYVSPDYYTAVAPILLE